MGITPIQWAPGIDDGRQGHTINPFRARDKATGKVGHFCCKISDGCKFCYSARLQARFGLYDFIAANRDKVELFLDESKLDDVMRRRRPTGYFWCDMSDLFLDDYPDDWIAQCFATMTLTPQHIHMVLTKRPERMRALLSDDDFASEVDAFAWEKIEELVDPLDRRSDDLRATAQSLSDGPLPNVRLGVSVENQDALWRIDTLKDIPAACRFVSFEPLLEDLGALVLDGIQWCIVGGESGPGARPMNIGWAQNILSECRRQNVVPFVKQLGARIIMPPGSTDDFIEANPAAVKTWFLVDCAHPPEKPRAVWRTNDSHGGNWDEWPANLRVREFPR